MLELNKYMPFHIMVALTILMTLDIMLALSYTTMPRQLPSHFNKVIQIIEISSRLQR